MKKIFIFLFLLCGAFVSKAQTLSTFEAHPYSVSVHYYFNASAPLRTNVGFNDGLAYFPTYFDSIPGYRLWISGFAYSNINDTLVGSNELYSNITASGYASNCFASVMCQNPYSSTDALNVLLTGAARGKSVAGFYITNNAVAYRAMRDGTTYSKKFGGPTSTDPDWYKLTVKGFRSGVLQSDSVEFYLADYRPAGHVNDSIVKSWHWVNLLPLGHVDSLQFAVSSSDTQGGYMRTPPLFCIDDFTTNETSLSTLNERNYNVGVYPVPAYSELHIDLNEANAVSVTILDITGKVMYTNKQANAHLLVNVSDWLSGNYIVCFEGPDKKGSLMFEKH
jgi:hypothetical protein